MITVCSLCESLYTPVILSNLIFHYMLQELFVSSRRKLRIRMLERCVLNRGYIFAHGKGIPWPTSSMHEQRPTATPHC